MYRSRELLALCCIFILNLSVALSTTKIQAPLLPYPQYLQTMPGKLHLQEFISVWCNDELFGKECEKFFENYGFHISQHQKATRISIRKTAKLDTVPHYAQHEGYYLSILPQGIVIEAADKRGLLRAVQTLSQWKEIYGYQLPCIDITDWPAFEYRGVMQDVARYYIPMQELKKQIRLLSRFKYNYFHLHLTEDISWRIQSHIYPQLNEPRVTLRQAGKYYTLDELSDLANYCTQYGMTLLPEIDMPGHSQAFTSALGFPMQSEQGKAALKALLTEFLDKVKVPILHIGTDEVKFTDPSFVNEMVAFIRGKGVKAWSWNPGWSYKPGEIDGVQLWSAWGKPISCTPAIDSRYYYLNHFDLFGDLVALFNSKIGGYNNQENEENIIGGEIAVWNDRIPQSLQAIWKENAFYPNALVFAERSWRGGGYDYFRTYGTNLPIKPNDSRLADFRSLENRMLCHAAHSLRDESFPYVKQSDILWRVTEQFPNAGDVSQSFPPEKEIKNTYSYQGKSYTTRLARGAGIYLRHTWGSLVKSLLEHPHPNSTVYAYTYIYSYKAQEVGAWIEFQNYSRSEKDMPPPLRQWDYRGSSIRVNGEYIQPPQWINSTKSADNEHPLTNENACSRPPAKIYLKKGWNEFLIKLPVREFTTPEIRLVKWMFTFVCVTPDGGKVAENIIYSPDKDESLIFGNTENYKSTMNL
ncbi:family 20 glycosylhydrolase [Porphyromonas pogonae]|uniref:family 20 glycosylhydrolase n=1 Tax=Porphyromonas pogonae TaxID=867595 RepID=UPI002E78287F|nr:family 20 glycosylhydrolase [Porphyromonas pogonae]